MVKNYFLNIIFNFNFNDDVYVNVNLNELDTIFNQVYVIITKIVMVNYNWADFINEDRNSNIITQGLEYTEHFLN